MTYKEIFEQGWQDLPEDRWDDALWNLTPYPSGSSQDLIDALKRAREGSNNDVDRAMDIAYEEVDRIMKQNKIKKRLRDD